VTSLSYCFRLNLSYINSICVLGSKKLFQFRISKYDTSFGFVYLKGNSTTFQLLPQNLWKWFTFHLPGFSFLYKIPPTLNFLPGIWYHVCFSYDPFKSHHLLVVINGLISLDEFADGALLFYKMILIKHWKKPAYYCFRFF